MNITLKYIKQMQFVEAYMSAVLLFNYIDWSLLSKCYIKSDQDTEHYRENRKIKTMQFVLFGKMHRQVYNLTRLQKLNSI